MKIKLNRDLWNHKANDVITVPDPNAIWAVKKGFAIIVEDTQAQNKAIDPKYKRNKLK